MQINVIKNAKKNIFFGIINKVIVMICPFVERTIIQVILGSSFLGLSSLFNSILSVLSLTELGFSSAVIYHMYKPVAMGDVKTVNALLNFYKKAYRIIGIIILFIGISIVPFINILIKGDYPRTINLYLLYIIFLFNSVISYFMFAYKSSLVVVYQRDDINSIINSIIKILMTVCQIFVLILTKNYYFFVLLMPIFTVVNNIWIAVVVKKIFPQYHCEGIIETPQRKSISKLVVGTFIQKACTVTRNSLDSICISSFLGLTMTAMYSNYYQIVYAVAAVLGIATNAIIGGIGNHVATRSKEENYQELKIMDFLFMTISGWCMTCLFCLLQPFMELWMGKQMQLPMGVVISFCLYFYVLKMGDMRSMYSTTNGLWWEHRYRSIAETVLNFTLNILLGKLYGVYGIIIATVISLLICNFWWGSRITFKLAFSKENLCDYYRYHLKYAIVGFIACMITFFFCSIIEIKSLIALLFFRLIVCSFTPPVFFFLIYRKTKLYKSIMHILIKKNN